MAQIDIIGTDVSYFPIGEIRWENKGIRFLICEFGTTRIHSIFVSNGRFTIKDDATDEEIIQAEKDSGSERCLLESCYYYSYDKDSKTHRCSSKAAEWLFQKNKIYAFLKTKTIAGNLSRFSGCKPIGKNDCLGQMCKHYWHNEANKGDLEHRCYQKDVVSEDRPGCSYTWLSNISENRNPPRPLGCKPELKET